MKYSIKTDYDERTDRWISTSSDFPGIMTFGESKEEAELEFRVSVLERLSKLEIE